MIKAHVSEGVGEGSLSTALVQEVFANIWISALQVYTRQIIASVDGLK